MRLALAFVLLALPAGAQAQVTLVSPECGSLPFDAQEVERLLTLELAVGEVELADEGGTPLGYRPVECAPGSSVFEVFVGAAPEHAAPVDVAEVPLAGVPRALALEMAEMARRHLAEPVEEAPEEVSEHVAAPVEQSAPEAAAGSSTDTDTDRVPEGSESHASPALIGFHVGFRNTPDTGAALAAARVFVDLPLARDLPLVVRLDLTGAAGAAAHDITLGWLEGGVSLALTADALRELSIRFGPRLWVGHGAVLDAGQHMPTRNAEDVQVGVGVVAGVDITVGAGLRLLLQAEVGANLHGLELNTALGRSGFLGAYWEGAAGLAWEL